jgi:hypothetical protein
VVALLQRKNGGTFPEPVEKVGWHKHTVRGFMAGAMKRAGYTSGIAMEPASMAVAVSRNSGFFAPQQLDERRSGENEDGTTDEPFAQELNHGHDFLSLRSAAISSASCRNSCGLII